MEEILFEDSLLESMEVVSFEERDINEVVRENAHALLECQMDLEDILESSGDNFFKRAFEKLKALWDKFIAWIKSIFNKIKNAGKSKEENKSNNHYQKILGNPVNDFNALPTGRDKGYYSTNIVLNYNWYDIYPMTKYFKGICNRLVSDGIRIENEDITWDENFNSIIDEIKNLKESSLKNMDISSIMINKNGDINNISDVIPVNEITNTRNMLMQSQKGIERKLWTITDESIRNRYAQGVLNILSMASNELMTAYRHNIDIYNAARQAYLTQMYNKYGFPR